MKFIFGFVMALLVLAFSVLPCADVPGSPVAGNRYELSPETAQHPSDHKDACSPFCACSCCAGHYVPVKLASVALPEPGQRSHFPTHPADPLYHLPQPVWQPPQLG